MKKFTKHSFTLIELLAVIGIVALLFGVFAPAFTRMMVGSKVDQMASNFKTGMELAQAKAVASRKFVAMIIPSKYDTVADSRLKPYCGGGYRLAYVKKDGDQWLFSGWVPGSQWRNMADGAMLTGIEQDDDWLDNNKKLKSLPTPESATNKAFSGSGKLTVIEPNGFDDASNGDSDVAAIYNATAANNNLKGLIFTPFGGCIVGGKPFIFFFTEAKVDGDGYNYPNTDNFVMLKLNLLTGKVIFLPTGDGE